jgi:hypothetical protein
MGAHEEGEQTMQATRDTDQLAAIAAITEYPILHGRLIPWYHRRKGLTTTQLELTPR